MYSGNERGKCWFALGIVPDTLPPGIYQLELLAGRYQRYHGRLVVQ